MVRGIAVAAPVVIATVAVAVFIVAERSGLEPLSLGYPRNIAEASGLGGAADVFRFLGDGADPARIYPVRRDVISGAVRYASAFEAAIWSTQVELVQVLDRRHPASPAERHRLACLARELQAVEIESYLAGGMTMTCEHSIVDAITARIAADEQ